MELLFSEVSEKAPSGPGLYEIYTNDGIALKVGIASNLNKRLIQHARSKQSALKHKGTGASLHPEDVKSKQSIPAKHLYFDSTLTGKFDLKTEKGRQDFLNNCCYLKILKTETRERARSIERELERQGAYRYIGRVIER